MFDLKIQNGLIFDGSGTEGFYAELAVKDGKIAAIGSDLGSAVETVDAKGFAVTPGFIDSHGHADKNVFTYPEQTEKAEQGITTSIGGQCGATHLWPVVRDGKLIPASEVLAKAEGVPQGANIASFIGHGALRRAVMGMENRPATKEEMEKMAFLLRDGIKAGALGISFGLVYTPGCYASYDELLFLARVAKESGGMVSAHIRNESDRLVEAVEEMIRLAREADVRFVFSHHKAMFRQNHGKVKVTLDMMNKAVAEGVDLYCDVYPYVASGTSLASRFVPSQYVNEHLPEFLQDPKLRKELKEMNIKKWTEDLSWVRISTCVPFPQYDGKNLNEAALLHGKDVYETLFDIISAFPTCHASFFAMCEEDVERVMKWERAMICTDSAVVCDSTQYHPRLRGTFPRVLGRYVRERGVTSLSEMIRKMTSLPASVYGLTGKGSLKVGYDADLCIFDPETILDQADFSDVTRRALGLSHVFIGGRLVAKNAVHTGERAGRVLLLKKMPQDEATGVAK